MNAKKFFKYFFYVCIATVTIWIATYFIVNNLADNTIKTVPYSEIKPDYGTDSFKHKNPRNHYNEAPIRNNDSTGANVSFNEPESPTFHYSFKHGFLPAITKNNLSSGNDKESNKENEEESNEDSKSQELTNTETTSKETTPSVETRKGRALTYKELPSRDINNVRMRFTLFFNSFKNNDYITGAELSKYYATDKNYNRLVKNTLCGFLENNVSRVTRVNNRLYITTIEANGIHKRIKIPLVEDMKIDIQNGSSLELKPTIKSKAPLFNNAFLLPIDLEGISISHNGAPFPTTGYLSGNFFFTEYANSRLGYQIK
jgi:hypothetical protein